ncbi:MAG: PEP-utilizing enzyme [Patescibacteria group bacterium]
MKPTVVFSKHYTRDTSLIIQQFWLESLSQGVRRLGINIRQPVGVDFVNNGVIEIWEDRITIRQIKSGLVDFCRQEPQQALALLKRYQAGLKDLQSVWRRGYLENLNTFNQYLAEVRSLVIGDLFIAFMGPEERVKGRVKAVALRLRSEDHFFAYNNRVMMATLHRLFPHLKSYVNVLRLEDLDKPPTLAECRRRFQKFISAPDGYHKIQSLAAYARSRGYILAKDEPERIKGGLLGRTAMPGQAKGRAKLVFSVRDSFKVRRGDIIISPMTTPEMLLAMKKAAAIVTDEGGVICHAAIVAREMKKPCLIATRTATKVFKDNELIMVDAGAGTVRRVGK